MGEKKENLEDVNQCKSIYIILKKFGINIYKKIKPIATEWWGIGLIAFIAMLTIFIFGYFYFSKHSLSWLSGEIEELGQMGDFFGGTLNPILAFLSFCLLLITIKLQSKELKNSTEELAKSSLALAEQSKSLQLQNFENTFFNMINLHNEIIKNISLEIKEKHQHIDFDGREIYYYSILDKKVALIEDKPYYGKNAILRLFEILNTHIKNNIEKNNIFKLYNEFHIEYDNNISHYFRNIYQILKFVNKQEILKDKDKNKEFQNQKFYTNILRAQFSSIEFTFLFINSLYKTESKLFPLLVKFEFLEPLTLVMEYTTPVNSQKFRPFYLDKSYIFEAIDKCIKETTDIEDENYSKSRIFGSNKYFLNYIKKTHKGTENE
ncbi:putative phage abortive infection protein [Aliarcobacter butzleri]|uniref:putative phage abortive infection protein n=1 Tax=Aliarcobacter butzleri TaxID=28197 RepID=UPI003B21D327